MYASFCTKQKSIENNGIRRSCMGSMATNGLLNSFLQMFETLANQTIQQNEIRHIPKRRAEVRLCLIFAFARPFAQALACVCAVASFTHSQIHEIGRREKNGSKFKEFDAHCPEGKVPHYAITLTKDHCQRCLL